MDRRREPRISVQADVEVTVLNAEPPRILTGRMVDLNGRGMRLALPCALPLDAPIKIDCPDRMYLGEVVHCSLRGEEWQVGVEVDQALVYSADLEALRASLAATNHVRGSEDTRNADVTIKVTTHGPREFRP